MDQTCQHCRKQYGTAFWREFPIGIHLLNYAAKVIVMQCRLAMQSICSLIVESFQSCPARFHFRRTMIKEFR
jgi:hypothetical protein